jgi:hypothetical protein
MLRIKIIFLLRHEISKNKIIKPYLIFVQSAHTWVCIISIYIGQRCSSTMIEYEMVISQLSLSINRILAFPAIKLLHAYTHTHIAYHTQQQLVMVTRWIEEKHGMLWAYEKTPSCGNTHIVHMQYGFALIRRIRFIAKYDSDGVKNFFFPIPSEDVALTLYCNNVRERERA